MRVLALAVIVGCSIGAVAAKSPSVDRTSGTDWSAVQFHLNQPALASGRYTIQIQTNGLGAYWVGPPDFSLDEAVGVSRIHVSQQSLRALAAVFSRVKAGNCETRLKNLAQTGRKTIVFLGNGLSVNCEFNYSDDPALNQAVDTFEAMAETMQLGERLQHDRRFDRLGLDADITSLADEVKLGHAIEVQNISGVLTSIAQDDRVIQRVRRVAAQLLQDAGIEGGTKGDGR